MADQDRKASAGGTSILCWPDTKAKYNHAMATLNASQAEIADLAIEALLPLIADEETPEQRRTRILGKSNSGRSRVRVQSESVPTAVAS